MIFLVTVVIVLKHYEYQRLPRSLVCYRGRVDSRGIDTSVLRDRAVSRREGKAGACHRGLYYRRNCVGVLLVGLTS